MALAKAFRSLFRHHVSQIDIVGCGEPGKRIKNAPEVGCPQERPNQAIPISDMRRHPVDIDWQAQDGTEQEAHLNYHQAGEELAKVRAKPANPCGYLRNLVRPRLAVDLQSTLGL